MNYSSEQCRTAIYEASAKITNMLIKKNESYGCSVFNPIGVFASKDAETLIRARLDDKISRLMTDSREFDDEDTILDMAGYLQILLALRILKEETDD